MSKVSPVIEGLLRGGVTLLCFYGPNATAHHHDADASIVGDRIRPGGRLLQQRWHIMTDGEDDGSLSGSAFYFINCTTSRHWKHFDYLAVIWGSKKFQTKVHNAIIRELPKGLLAGP